ncbi:MAG: xanthine dehydrogenase molybdopterin binding subunit [Lautropia sp.]
MNGVPADGGVANAAARAPTASPVDGSHDAASDPAHDPARDPAHDAATDPASGSPSPSQPTAQVGRSVVHESAHLHVTGGAAYTDDLPELAGTLHAALALSPHASGRWRRPPGDFKTLQRLAALPDVVSVLSAADIPGTNDCGPILHDDPILCDGPLRYLGQPLVAVIATDRVVARRIAATAAGLLTFDRADPVLDPRDAHAAGRAVIAPMHLERRSVDGGARAAIAAAPRRLAGSLEVGGQEQFYLEGQVSYAVPLEDGAMRVHCSTQHPSEMQQVVAHALGVAAHKVQVECRRMGGGFGGKESQSAQFAAIAAVAAHRLGTPVKLRLDRDDDFLVTGKRHCFSYDYEVGFDDEGRVLGLVATLISRAGHSADLSGPVMTRALCHVDNAYWLPDVELTGHSARTDTQSNTAFRGFGGPQGAILIEYLLDSIARVLKIDPLDVRTRNFYRNDGGRNLTPYGQPVDDEILAPLTAELARSSGYRARRASVDAFNAQSPILKRGLALTPVKFGIAFNLRHFNQAGALVHVYRDGSVIVNHGGTEMGQGLNTKVAQVVAHELGVDVSRVRATAADTQKVANTSATAASTGSDLNGMAAQAAARTIRTRLAACVAARHGLEAPSVHFADGQVAFDDPAAGGARRRMSFAEVVELGYVERVQLWADGFYATPGLSWDQTGMKGSPFQYFAYGAAVAEVVVDRLTGESRVLRVDILHDAGRSLNPAIDIGQIEGGFIQGMGWLTMEELAWHPDSGKLTTHAPSTYKIPTANDCPAEFRVALWPADNRADTIHRSKAVGEPPLLLGFSVFFAIRDAVSAAGEHRIDPPLRAPATAEAILAAIDAVRQPAGAGP